MTSEALLYIHGEPGRRFFSSHVLTEITEGALGSHYVQYNSGDTMVEIRVAVLLDEGDRYSVVTFLERSSDPDDFDTSLHEENASYHDSLPEAITAFGEEAVMISLHDNDDELARINAVAELNRLRERFGISSPRMKF